MSNAKRTLFVWYRAWPVWEDLELASVSMGEGGCLEPPKLDSWLFGCKELVNMP